jgi:hypothetical protein
VPSTAGPLFLQKENSIPIKNSGPISVFIIENNLSIMKYAVKKIWMMKKNTDQIMPGRRYCRISEITEINNSKEIMELLTQKLGMVWRIPVA